MIEVKQIRVVSGKGTLLDDVNFRLEKGEILAVAGKEGAGKTTLLDALTGVSEIESGSIAVYGIDMHESPSAAKSHIGYAPADAALYPDMTGRSFLKFVGSTREIPARQIGDRAAKALSLLSVAQPDADEPIRFLPDAIKRKLNVAQALLSEPDVLVVDSNSEALDPQTVSVLRKAYREYAKEHAVLLATDNLTEAMLCANRVLVLDEGKVVAFGTPAELSVLARRDGILHIATVGNINDVRSALSAVEGVEILSAEDAAGELRVTLDQKKRDLRAEIGSALFAKGLPILEMRGEAGGLDDLLAQLRTDSRAPEKEDVPNDERV